MLQHQHLQQRLNTGGQIQNISPFLCLPAELRNQIYEYVFQGWIVAPLPSPRGPNSLKADIYPATANPCQATGRKETNRANRPLNFLGLLYTCRKVHAEARFLPYRLNKFFCGERSFPPAWLNILHDQLAEVRSLTLCSYMLASITLSRIWLEALPWFTSIEKVDVFYHLRVPPWGQEEDHLATATKDEAEMERKIIRATSAACNVVFHRFIISDWD